MSNKYIIVTRHPALVTYILEARIAPVDTPVVTHVTDDDDVRDKHVVGVQDISMDALPMRLAALAATVTEIPLQIPEYLRGKELSYHDMKEVAGEAVTYVVNTRAARHQGKPLTIVTLTSPHREIIDFLTT